jgi:hypothetical protein
VGRDALKDSRSGPSVRDETDDEEPVPKQVEAGLDPAKP